MSLLAYPNGTVQDYNQDTIAAARHAGHAFAVTTRGAWSGPETPPLEIRRLICFPERGARGLARDLARILAGRGTTEAVEADSPAGGG